MAKATPAAIALYRKAGAFEMSRVPCIERYSQFIRYTHGTKRPPISRPGISCILLLLTYVRALHCVAQSAFHLSRSINLLLNEQHRTQREWSLDKAYIVQNNSGKLIDGLYYYKKKKKEKP